VAAYCRDVGFIAIQGPTHDPRTAQLAMET
jgi:hypothetical protein